ncbi:phage capsid protein [Prosthecobacter sp. SYSU 5D2]|uniref:phage capsid protein n=1 Tax=Prosthecobacter sp. SYSU 5D2 TaxID=3134134 RepID=UPI0031FF30EA
MPFQVPQFFTTDFSRNWEMLAQQKDSRLGPTVTADSFFGKRKKYNQLDVGEMTEVTDRKGVTPDHDTTGRAYWIYRRKFHFTRTWDEDDSLNLGQVALPDSDEMQSAVAAGNRTKDKVIIQAFDGSRKVEDCGTEEEAFNLAGTQQVAANYGGSNSGLTVEKIIRAKKILDENEVDDGDRFFVVASHQLNEDMLTSEKITSGDYMQVKALIDGQVDRFAGFTFVRSEQLPKSGQIRSAFAYHKSGIKWADNGRSTHVDIRADKNHAVQMRAVYRMGAVRTEDKRIVRVLCDEAP